MWGTLFLRPVHEGCRAAFQGLGEVLLDGRGRWACRERCRKVVVHVAGITGFRVEAVRVEAVPVVKEGCADGAVLGASVRVSVR